MAGTSKKKKPQSEVPWDAESWASSNTPTSSVSCRTCAKPDVREAIRKVLTVWAEGAGHPSMRALYTKIQTHFDYPHNYTALRDHIQNHERELWAKVQARKEVADG